MIFAVGFFVGVASLMAFIPGNGIKFNCWYLNYSFTSFSLPTDVCGNLKGFDQNFVFQWRPAQRPLCATAVC